LAAEIRSKYPNADVKLIASSGGRFEVTRDGVPIFEKSKLHRHAKPGEVVQLLGTSKPEADRQ
jgi:predicted Rdx family selenoprotein